MARDAADTPQMPQGRMDRFVVISGCSGGGKSTLVAELRRRWHAVVAEPGRRIVKEELKSDGSALPWVDAVAFMRRAVAMARGDYASAAALDGWVFFDRGLVDAAAALQYLTGEQALADLAHSHRYHRRVFLTPPWPTPTRSLSRTSRCWPVPSGILIPTGRV